MARVTTEAKVGLFVLLGIALLVFMSLRLGEFRIFRPKGYTVYAIFDSAAGLKLNVPVEIAGVEVGRVAAVELENGKARVSLRIRPEVKLSQDATATIRTKGILGDRYIELAPGSPDQPKLADGGRITKTVTPPELDKLFGTLGEISEDVRRVTGTFSDVMGDETAKTSLREIIQNVRELSENLNRAVRQNMAHFDAIMRNFGQFSGDLKDISVTNKESINAIIASLRTSSENLQGAITAVRQMADKINQGEGTLGRLVNDPQTVENLNATLASLKDISDRINRGEGSIGKLVNDEETVDSLNEALTGLNRVLSREERFKTILGYRGELLTERGDLKSYLSLQIQPRPDKYYLIEVVEGPGRHKRDGRRAEDEVTFSGEIAKRWGDLLLRGGMIQSSGGFGLDYYLFDDAVKVSFEAFDFNAKKNNPYLRVAADYTFLERLYVTVGYDDFISKHGDASFFIGAGFRFLDEDLKALLGGGAPAAAAAAGK
ncbi:MAG: Mammalian cell entry related domain protein [Deltaproteobacteria bacterium]|nr:Mammalian cell entry related domain protein [Deltaproteobacteria bacterium]